MCLCTRSAPLSLQELTLPAGGQQGCWKQHAALRLRPHRARDRDRHLRPRVGALLPRHIPRPRVGGGVFPNALPVTTCSGPTCSGPATLLLLTPPLRAVAQAPSRPRRLRQPRHRERHGPAGDRSVAAVRQPVPAAAISHSGHRALLWGPPCKQT